MRLDQWASRSPSIDSVKTLRQGLLFILFSVSRHVYNDSLPVPVVQLHSRKYDKYNPAIGASPSFAPHRDVYLSRPVQRKIDIRASISENSPRNRRDCVSSERERERETRQRAKSEIARSVFALLFRWAFARLADGRRLDISPRVRLN